MKVQLLTILTLLLTLTGCGQKGDLYLPDSAPAATNTSANQAADAS